MATRNYWERFSCPICGEGFTLAQWEVRHNGRNGEEYHKDCCPECKDGTAYDEEVICAACGLPITGEDYANRVWGHEPGCNPEADGHEGCDCDLEYHEACAPAGSYTEEPWPDLRGKVIAA